MIKGPVERFELPNLYALNFPAPGALDGGGTISSRPDAQERCFPRRARMEIEVKKLTAIVFSSRSPAASSPQH